MSLVSCGCADALILVDLYLGPGGHGAPPAVSVHLLETRNPNRAIARADR